MRKVLCILMAGATAACAGGPVGNTRVPEPAKPVELSRYVGKWYELVRYENSFEKDCEGVTAEYARLPNDNIEVINTCRERAVDGVVRVAKGEARIDDKVSNAKLKVSFFGPFFFGDYWVLDRSEDYSWAIVGEPSGRYLWILSRQAVLSQAQTDALIARAAELGYDRALMRPTKQPPAV